MPHNYLISLNAFFPLSAVGGGERQGREVRERGMMCVGADWQSGKCQQRPPAIWRQEIVGKTFDPLVQMDKGPKKRKVEQKGLKQKNIVIDASVRQNVNVNSSVNSPPVLNEEEEDRV